MSIFEFLMQQNPEGRDSACRLPDHDALPAEAANAWVPGAYEALLMRSLYSIRRPALMNYLLARKVRRQILYPSEKNRERMENAILKASAIAVADPLISFLTSFALPREAVARAARTLARETDRRELVKVGIALLGSFGTEADFDDTVRPFGFHEEFSFYACPAARSVLGEARVNAYLLSLAEATDGWGKIAALYELNFDDPEARAYLLRRGCANRLGFAEAANLCATKGDLAGTLEELICTETVPDAELYRGICDIFTGLLAFDGVHDSLNDYKDGNRARLAFAELFRKNPALAQQDRRTEEILHRMR